MHKQSTVFHAMENQCSTYNADILYFEICFLIPQVFKAKVAIPMSTYFLIPQLLSMVFNIKVHNRFGKHGNNNSIVFILFEGKLNTIISYNIASVVYFPRKPGGTHAAIKK